jgi:hypothetical protein
LRLTAFDTYALFLALKQHFTQDNYDFFKYHGKTRANKESFIQRKDRFQFQKLSRKYDANEMQDFLVANLLKGKSWIGEFLDDEAHDNYMAYMKRKQALTYTFTNELDTFFSKEPPEHAFRVGEMWRSIPPILNYRMCGDLSVETYIILDDFLGFSKVLDRKMSEDYLWHNYNKPAQKFRPFLKYDKEKMKLILKEKLHEYRLPSEKQEASFTPQRETQQS